MFADSHNNNTRNAIDLNITYSRLRTTQNNKPYVKIYNAMNKNFKQENFTPVQRKIFTKFVKPFFLLSHSFYSLEEYFLYFQ